MTAFQDYSTVTQLYDYFKSRNEKFEIKTEKEKMSFYAITWKNNNLIEIEEPYLVFLWCLSYWVIKAAENNNQPTDVGNNVFRHGFSLFSGWAEWPIGLLNPNDEDKEVNKVFFYAGQFIYLHECAHIELGHNKKENKPAYEDAADEYACDELLKEQQELNIPNIKLGILVGISALLFTNKGEWKIRDYPDTDDRVKKILNKLCTDENDSLWEKAINILELWKDMYFNLNLSAKNRFTLSLSHLKTDLSASC